MPPPVSPAKYVTAKRLGLCTAIISDELGADPGEVDELIRIGSVYRNRGRLTRDVPVKLEDHFLVHLAPRRFPVAGIDWQSRIVGESQDFLVLDKPGGIPVHPTCDNIRENVVAEISRVLDRHVWLTHRLDIATLGLMILAKNREACGRLNRQFELRAVEKKYRALVGGAIAPGPYVHFMATTDRAPRLVSTVETSDAKRCALEIERCVARDSSGIHEIDLVLHTGRHHQIRAQTAALGAPVVGDELYGSSLAAPQYLGNGEVIALQSRFLAFEDVHGSRLEFSLPAPWHERNN